jgi:AAA domain
MTKAFDDVNDTLRKEGPDGVRARHDRARKYEGEANGGGLHDRGWHFYDDAPPAPMRWLIKAILPETGVGILAGQWGAYKTTVALDLSVCVMTGLLFAGRYRVKRRGAVLYIAVEGEGTLKARLRVIAEHRGVSNSLPFAWRGDCPPLTDKNAADALCRLADEAAADLKRRFGLPVALIWVDTMVTAAGYAPGEDNDTAATQRVMSALRRLSRHTGALAIGIDHFGKVVETGTKGSSNKEASADTVLAVLAERELAGGVKNTRLAIRKQRDGVSGFEIPFTARHVETGTDEDGEPITRPILDWQGTRETAQQADPKWSPSLLLLRRVLMTMLADCGQKSRPFLDGPEVLACDTKLVRAEFYRQHPADGTDEQKAETRRKAFNRAIKDAQARGLVATREVDGVQLIWLTTPETTNA